MESVRGGGGEGRTMQPCRVRKQKGRMSGKGCTVQMLTLAVGKMAPKMMCFGAGKGYREVEV